MSKGPSPTAIGSFVIAGMALAIGAAIYFGSVSFSTGDPRFVMFFDESVAGLGEGAKVKLRGVPIGTVKRIALRLPNQADGDPRIPVFVEISTDALHRLGALANVSDYDESLKRAIERGLRGRLQMESLITGMYYVELDFESEPTPPIYAQDPERIEYREIPTLPSQFAAIGRTASDMATQIATIPFDELSRHMLSLVESIDLILSELRERELIDTVADTLESVRDQVKTAEMGRPLEELRLTMQNLNKVLAQAGDKVDPIATELEKTLAATQASMEALHRAGTQIDDALAPNSALRYGTEKVMAELAEAADAIGRLADQLERNPSAVLRGKATKEISR